MRPHCLSVSLRIMFACTLGLVLVAAPKPALAQAPHPAEAIKAGDLPEAARQARRLAEMGDTQSQFMWSLFLWHGVATPQNFDEAMRWVTLAAVAGERKANNARNAMLKTVEPTVAQKSMEWVRNRLSKEAEAGDNDALLRLSASFSPAFGFANPVEAYFWSNLAVSSGRIEARKQRDQIVTQLKPADVQKTQERARVWHERWRASAASSALTEPVASKPQSLASEPEAQQRQPAGEQPVSAPQIANEAESANPQGGARE